MTFKTCKTGKMMMCMCMRPPELCPKSASE